MNSKEFEEYEQHLAMFNDALSMSEAHALHLCGRPIKPEGYDEWKKLQPLTELEQRIKEYEERKKEKEDQRRKEQQKTNIISTQNYTGGYEHDENGIPKYLTAHDRYMGDVNPEWEKKQPKKSDQTQETTQIRETNPNEKEGVNYDDEGIPEYLTQEAYRFGEANPAWLAKHEPKK